MWGCEVEAVLTRGCLCVGGWSDGGLLRWLQAYAQAPAEGEGAESQA
jgi:hypothetical protein